MRFASTIVAAGLAALALTATTASAAVAQTAPGNAAQSTSGESLSGKLSKSGGVITPNTGIDPGIKVPAPDPHPNSTPVIPPSANGGGTAK